MEIDTSQYELMGKFYLGRGYDTSTKELVDELTMYDSKDLVTHGVVLGMTGSGKTGLCIALLEEAAMDSIPAIVIDPKGDIPNLLLQFPELSGEDFRPWINEGDAAKKGLSPDDYAEKQAAMWKKGLGEWGQDGERIRELGKKADINVFTPGSNAGIPVSILASLDVPEFEILDDGEMLAERIESTVSSLLSLMGIQADPIQSPEHILLSNIFLTCWKNDESLTLQSLIHYIQTPPFEQIGVVPTDDFIKEKDRKSLAMKLNSLLASPGFSTWLKGVPLDMHKMLYAPDGRARISIFSIAHLSDSERMFFVSLLLNQMLGWMRSQSGTTSLRAMLYMDEIYGYLPPTANPPSKKPMMTMLKQARAYGLGLLLATQNPVDLDYKALSNIGTWWLGRLQTERDKARVLEGLEGAASSQSSTFDRGKMEQLLAGLGSRVFLMNNVHDDAPTAFHVRWVMSYLPGPLARTQIKTLMDPKRDQFQMMEHTAAEKSDPRASSAKHSETDKPAVSSRISEYFVPVSPDNLEAEMIYMPGIVRSAKIRFSDAKKGINGDREITQIHPLTESSTEVAWDDLLVLPEGTNMSHLHSQSHNAKEYGELPALALEPANYTAWKEAFADDLYHNERLEVLHAPAFDLYSQANETEGEFRGRLRLKERELRDHAVREAELKYEKKIRDTESGLEKAKKSLREQQDQANAAKLNAVIRVGNALFSGLLGGRKKISTTRTRSAASGASKAWKEDRDVPKARQKVKELEGERESLMTELETQVASIRETYNPETAVLEPVPIPPLKKNIKVTACGLVWLPYRKAEGEALEKAWL